jgi:hypothetical protein
MRAINPAASILAHSVQNAPMPAAPAATVAVKQ